MTLHEVLSNGFRIVTTLVIFPTLSRADARVTSQLPLGQQTVGFRLGEPGIFDGLALAPACEEALYQQISCDALLSTLGRKTYHGSPGDQDLTHSVCTASCSSALTTARRLIFGACASTPDLLPGYPVLALLDSIVTGWEETCLKDSTAGEYCNGNRSCRLLFLWHANRSTSQI